MILHDPRLMPRQGMRLWPLVLVAALGAAAIIWVVYPGPQSPAEHANRQRCAANLRQIHRALDEYAKGHGGDYPASLGDLLDCNLNIRAEDFMCPSREDAKSYIYLGKGLTRATTRAATSATRALASDRASGLLTCEAPIPTTRATTRAATSATRALASDRILVYEDLSNHLEEGMHILWADGTVQWANKGIARWVVKELREGRQPTKGKAK